MSRNKEHSLVRILLEVIGCLLIIAIIVGAGLQVFGKGKVKPSEWFKKSECEHVYENGKCTKCGAEEPKEEKSAFIVSSSDMPDASVMSISYALARTSGNGDGIGDTYDLTLDVKPVESIINDFTWSLQYTNWSAPSIPVNEVVELTANQRKATVKLLQPFEHEIKLRCEYNEDTSIYATCELDYECRYESLTIQGFNPMNFNDGEDELRVSRVNYGIGTFSKGQTHADSFWYELSDEAFNAVKNSQYYKQWKEKVGDNFDLVQSEADGYNGKHLYDPISDYQDITNASPCLEFFVSSANGEIYGPWSSSLPYYSENQYLIAAFKEMAESTTNQVRCCASVFDGKYVGYTEYGTVPASNFQSALFRVDDVNFGSSSLVF